MGREVVVAITKGKLDFGPWEQIVYGEFDGNRPKRVLVKIIGEQSLRWTPQRDAGCWRDGEKGKQMTANQILTVERKRIDRHRLYGVMVGQSDTLILLHKEYDFQFDGYSVIRRKDISKSFFSDSNDYCAKLMKKEGRWEQVPRRITKLPLDSWASLLSRFVGKVVILENERTDDFYIGPVEEITDTGVVVRYFDGCGKWMANEHVPFSKITRLTFGDRYSTTHEKYLKKR
jgi:hypothetical protein